MALLPSAFPASSPATCGGANRRQQLRSAAGKRRRRRRRCLRGALDTPAPLPTPTPRARGGFLPTRRPPCCLPCEKREKEDEGRRGNRGDDLASYMWGPRANSVVTLDKTGVTTVLFVKGRPVSGFAVEGRFCNSMISRGTFGVLFPYYQISR